MLQMHYYFSVHCSNAVSGSAEEGSRFLERYAMPWATQ